MHVGHAQQSTTTEHKSSFPDQRKSYRSPSRLVTPECWDLKEGGRAENHSSTEQHREVYDEDEDTGGAVSEALCLLLAARPLLACQDAPMHFVVQVKQAHKTRGCISNS